MYLCLVPPLNCKSQQSHSLSLSLSSSTQSEERRAAPLPARDRALLVSSLHCNYTMRPRGLIRGTPNPCKLNLIPPPASSELGFTPALFVSPAFCRVDNCQGSGPLFASCTGIQQWCNTSLTVTQHQLNMTHSCLLAC